MKSIILEMMWIQLNAQYALNSVNNNDTKHVMKS